MLSTILHDSVNFFYKKKFNSRGRCFSSCRERWTKKKKKKQNKNKILSPRLPTQNLPSFLFYLI